MSDLVGKQLGHYQLTHLLGRGGFADVYLGKHVYLDTQAAIKVLYTQLASDSIEHFRTEARTIAGLVHPHIVRVLDFGVEGTTPFLVMDYAPNGTLRQLHPRGTRLPLAIVVSYVKQIASALQYAHDHKVIHRDIKPENLLLGRNHEVLLSDFGIALFAQSSRYQSTQDMAGTIAYMAPEQIEAHPRPASDQYSLGIVVYEWLSGDRPFHGSFTEIAIKHSVVPPPSLREQVPMLPPAVEHVVMTVLAKDPKQRFARVQAFATALEQASQVAPSMIAPPSWIPQPTNAMDSLNQPQQRTSVAPPMESTGAVAASKQSSQPPVTDIPQRRSFAAERSTDKLQQRQRSILWRAIALGLAALVIAASIGIFYFTTTNQSAGTKAIMASQTLATATTSTKAITSSSPLPSPTPSPTLTACQKAFSDEFNGSLDARWSWIDPRNDSTHSVTARPGYLRVSTSDGHDLFPGNNYDAPRLLQLIDGDFTITTLVEFDPHYQYQGAGFLIWQDANNFLRLERSYGDFASSVSGVHLDQDENGVYSDVAPTPQHLTTATRVELRVQRSGEHFTTSWREPGNAWQVVGETVIHLSSVMVGLDLIAQHGVPQTTADYDYFTVSCS